MIGHDVLPQSSAVSALVRRIAFRLDAELLFNGHPVLSHEERAALFDLGDASTVLDRLATLPRMAQHEERARRDLLELYDIFDRTLEDAADSFDGQVAAAEEAHNKQLDAREANPDGDAQGCQP